jgi:hypothetical protein
MFRTFSSSNTGPAGLAGSGGGRGRGGGGAAAAGASSFLPHGQQEYGRHGQGQNLLFHGEERSKKAG